MVPLGEKTINIFNICNFASHQFRKPHYTTLFCCKFVSYEIRSTKMLCIPVYIGLIHMIHFQRNQNPYYRLSYTDFLDRIGLSGSVNSLCKQHIPPLVLYLGGSSSYIDKLPCDLKQHTLHWFHKSNCKICLHTFHLSMTENLSIQNHCYIW